MEYCTYKNVPKDVVQLAVDWHNRITGDEWTVLSETHLDIQHRIKLLADYCPTCYMIKSNGTFVDYRGDL